MLCTSLYDSTRPFVTRGAPRIETQRESHGQSRHTASGISAAMFVCAPDPPTLFLLLPVYPRSVKIAKRERHAAPDIRQGLS